MNYSKLWIVMLYLTTSATLSLLSPKGAMGRDIRRNHRISGEAPASSPAPSEDNQHSDAGVEDWLLKERVIILSGGITAETVEPIIAKLLYLDSQAPGQDIYLYINSVGGEIVSGLAVYDTLRSLRSDVVTVSLGESYSMGSVLLAAGTKGKRLALPNSRIMIHQAGGGADGQARDVEIEAKELLFMKNRLNRLLAELTGQSLKQIETDTDRNFYLSAEAAKTYGIVDRVVKQLPSASRPLKGP